MDLRVDDEYFISTFDFYNNKVKQVDDKIERFKSECDGLFSTITFGEQLDIVLKGKATAFIGKSLNSMQKMMDKTQILLEDFLDGVEDNDSL